MSPTRQEERKSIQKRILILIFNKIFRVINTSVHTSVNHNSFTAELSLSCRSQWVQLKAGTIALPIAVRLRQIRSCGVRVKWWTMRTSETESKLSPNQIKLFQSSSKENSNKLES